MEIYFRNSANMTEISKITAKLNTFIYVNRYGILWSESQKSIVQSASELAKLVEKKRQNVICRISETALESSRNRNFRGEPWHTRATHGRNGNYSWIHNPRRWCRANCINQNQGFTRCRNRNLRNSFWSS